jgi:hypothetical protein
MKLVGVPMAQPLIKEFKGGPPGDSVVSHPTIEDLTLFKNPAKQALTALQEETHIQRMKLLC